MLFRQVVWILPLLGLIAGGSAFSESGKAQLEGKLSKESAELPQLHAKPNSFAKKNSRPRRGVRDSDFYDDGEPPEAKVELGRLLFFDPVLSGNQNISCATCHHSLAATGDGLSLSVGEGGGGLGVTRDNGFGPDAVHERVPRNAPPVFNLGAREFSILFADGRVAVDDTQPSGFSSPAGTDLPFGLDNVLAAQAMFPVTSAAEMAGQPGENIQADLAEASDLPALWLFLSDKLRGIPEYVDLFIAAYPDEVFGPADITFVQAANAIAAFEAKSWRFTNSPFDRFLNGERNAMSRNAKRGKQLFYGRRLACGTCHSNRFQTDQEFHAIGMPQIGPGKGDGFDGREDFGRARVTANPEDRYKFRTPTLRNVRLTGPWGHSGAYDTLEAVVLHHFNPVDALENYDQSQAVLPSRADLDALDFIVMDDPTRVAEIAAASEIERLRIRPKDMRYLMDFLDSLTDPAALDMRKDVPRRLPSGLPLAN